LSSHGDLAAAILNCFSSPSEEIKSAASFALGKPDQYTTVILHGITNTCCTPGARLLV